MKLNRTLSLLALVVAAGHASASVTYRFITSQASYAAAPGGMVTISVLLEETVTGTSTSVLSAQNGLFSAGVRVTRIGSLPSDPARFVGPAAVASNTNQFWDTSNAVFAPVVTIATGEAKLLEFARAAGVSGSPTGPGVRAISLGNFNLTAGTIIGQATTFQISDYAATSDTVTWNTPPWVLDAAPYGIAGLTVTVTVVNPGCYANCDGSTTSPILNINDFQCFLSRFGAGDVYANCDGSTASPTLNINDFQCFINRFAIGCT